jgi:hypothetical protein
VQREMRAAPQTATTAGRALLLACLQHGSELRGVFEGGEQGAEKSNSRPHKLTANSDSQALAAFGAACVDHGAAAFGFHAHEKAMRASAAGFGRLISTFHDRSSSCDWE